MKIHAAEPLRVGLRKGKLRMDGAAEPLRVRLRKGKPILTTGGKAESEGATLECDHVASAKDKTQRELITTDGLHMYVGFFVNDALISGD